MKNILPHGTKRGTMVLLTDTEVLHMSKTVTNLERIRREVGMTQKSLSEKSGVCVATIKEYEMGRCDINNARIYLVVALSDALGVSVKDIMN